MILNAETREHVSAVGAGPEHPPRQDTLTFFEGSALNYGNYLDEVWTLDKRSGGVTVADLNDGTGTQRHFYHCNTLYHVYALTDETGAIAEAVQSYDAYGKISALITGSGSDTTWFTSDDVTATNPNVSTIGNTFFYTGQRVDPETGLGYWKNRYFSYDLGRWVSRDPIGYLGWSLNLYEYAHGMPTYELDSLGLYVVAQIIYGPALMENKRPDYDFIWMISGLPADTELVQLNTGTITYRRCGSQQYETQEIALIDYFKTGKKSSTRTYAFGPKNSNRMTVAGDIRIDQQRLNDNGACICVLWKNMRIEFYEALGVSAGAGTLLQKLILGKHSEVMATEAGGGVPRGEATAGKKVGELAYEYQYWNNSKDCTSTACGRELKGTGGSGYSEMIYITKGQMSTTVKEYYRHVEDEKQKGK